MTHQCYGFVLIFVALLFETYPPPLITRIDVAPPPPIASSTSSRWQAPSRTSLVLMGNQKAGERMANARPLTVTPQVPLWWISVARIFCRTDTSPNTNAMASFGVYCFVNKKLDEWQRCHKVKRTFIPAGRMKQQFRQFCLNGFSRAHQNCIRGCQQSGPLHGFPLIRNDNVRFSRQEFNQLRHLFLEGIARPSLFTRESLCAPLAGFLTRLTTNLRHSFVATVTLAFRLVRLQRSRSLQCTAFNWLSSMRTGCCCLTDPASARYAHTLLCAEKPASATPFRRWQPSLTR